MEPNTQIFLEHVLTRNMVFVLFFATLFPVASGFTVKESLRTGFKLALVLTAAGLVASAAFSLTSSEMQFLNPVFVMVISIAAIRAVDAWSELQGEWAGLPRKVLFLAPLAGLQTYLWMNEITGLDAVLTVFGSTIGFFGGGVLVASFIEQIWNSNNSMSVRRIGTLFASIAIIGLSLAGFKFL